MFTPRPGRDPRLAELDRALAGLEAGGPAPAGAGRADPYRAGRSALDRLDAVLALGRVDLHLPFHDWVRVRTAEFGPVAACVGGPVGTGPWGPRDLQPLPPGTPVVLWRPPGTAWWAVLCALPPAGAAGRVPDYLQMGGNTGLKRTPFWRALSALPGADAHDFAGGRPLDQAGGERGVLSAGGCGYWVSDFQAEVRAGEEAALTLLPFDGGYARLAGRQFDLLTGAYHLQVRDDEGECRLVAGDAVYPWELVGRSGPGQAFAQPVDPAESQTRPTGKGPVDLTEPRLRPFFRRVRYGGYLGQGGLTVVQLPPADGPGVFGQADARVGVVVSHTSLAGGRTELAADSFVVGRRVSLPAPADVWPAEHPAGDDAAAGGYRASGVYGDGPAHDPDSDRPDLRRAGDLVALLRRRVEWGVGHPFRLHEKDWALPADGAGPLGEALGPLDYSDLAAGGPVGLPEPVEHPVDHRQTGRYRPVENLTAYLPDGEVGTVDGGGGDDWADGAGTRRISQPGDVVVQAGRRFVVMADEIVFKANRAVELSTSAGSIRLKAETDVEVLAGNGGAGGVLVESRGAAGLVDGKATATTPRLSGVTLASREAPVSLAGAGVYLRTGGGAGDGDVVLDAPGGRVVARADTVELAPLDRLLVPVGSPDAPDVVHAFTAAQVTLDAPVTAGGLSFDRDADLVVTGTASVGGDVLVAGGLFVDPDQGGEAPADLADRIDRVVAAAGRAADLLRAAAEAAWEAVRTRLLTPGRPGDPASVLSVFRFRHRDDPAGADYRTGGLTLTEPRYQRLARAGLAGAGSPWVEPDVATPEGPTQPWPGRTAWTLAPTLARGEGGDAVPAQAGWLFTPPPPPPEPS